MAVPALPTGITPDQVYGSFDGVDETSDCYGQAFLPLTVLIAEEAVMSGVLSSEVPSDSPNVPILARVREDDPTLWEIADGHHRVAEAIRQGCTHIAAHTDDQPDDEPYPAPFFDFTRPYATAG